MTELNVLASQIFFLFVGDDANTRATSSLLYSFSSVCVCAYFLYSLFIASDLCMGLGLVYLCRYIFARIHEQNSVRRDLLRKNNWSIKFHSVLGKQKAPEVSRQSVCIRDIPNVSTV